MCAMRVCVAGMCVLHVRVASKYCIYVLLFATKVRRPTVSNALADDKYLQSAMHAL
jgi:hypothetical protein